jgi:hypothetical protein
MDPLRIFFTLSRLFSINLSLSVEGCEMVGALMSLQLLCMPQDTLSYHAQLCLQLGIGIGIGSVLRLSITISITITFPS